jgi:hypothetical protein
MFGECKYEIVNPANPAKMMSGEFRKPSTERFALAFHLAAYRIRQRLPAPKGQRAQITVTQTAIDVRF